MSEEQTQSTPAKIRQPRKISPFWLLPLVAFIIGALLFFQILQERGQIITIRFQDGAGITAGKTVIRYQGLEIGRVKKVSFANGLKEIEVSAEVDPEAKSVLRKGTKFWLVQPSASLAGISGLDALVSGNYITLLPGEGDSEDEFTAESEPPLVPVTDGDLLVKLVADDLGSISVGASVYFRKVPVGTISDYRFSANQQKVEIDVVIDKKYVNLVKRDSHFWNISGINASANFNGISVSVDSLMSIVQGAVAFDSPDNSQNATQGQTFELYPNLKLAQRGISVAITLPPDTPQVKVNETGVYYQGMQIGILSNLTFGTHNQADNPPPVTGTLLIDPAYANLLRSESLILLKEPSFSLDREQLSKIGELLRGHYFEIVQGKGEEQLEFAVQKESDYLLTRPNTLAITLEAPYSFGVDQGQSVYYNDVKIGEILQRHLAVDKVSFQAIIFPPYRQLITGDSKFVAISNLDVSVGLDGMRVHAGSPSSWLLGGVRVIAGKEQSEAKTQYPLYKDVDSAEAGITNSEKVTTLSLKATELSGIDKGSVVLYRDFPIGEVLQITPQQSHFNVALFIEPRYRHLLSEKSRFWIEPALQAELSTSGVKIQSAPLMRMLRGAISFDNNGSKGDKTLYTSHSKAVSGNTYLTLIAKDASKLSQGMPIKYMGLTIGQVESLKLESGKKQIKATAYIEGQYYALVATAGSKFRAVSTEISTAGVKNLDAALQNYINVEIGSGARTTQFQLGETDTNATQYGNGFPIILETTNANGISPDAPLLYRGMQVGVVSHLSLSELGDRVLIHLKVNNKYKHLVRTNSQFWQASGYTMDITFSGASINSGTLPQLLNGGIEFSTPSGSIVKPQASANSRFLLQRKVPEGAPSWNQGVAE